MFATTEPQCVDVAQLEALSDAELTRMVKSGSDTALGVLLWRHRDPLYRFCLHLMRDPHDAEDICQESLARAIMRVDSLQSGAAFRGWLFSIARNLSVDAFRARKRVCSIPDEEITILPPALQDDNPYGDLEIGEEYQTVAFALGRLKQNHQAVLMLREVQRLSYAEIARQLDVSESAVETLLFRARRRLREEYIRADAPTPISGLIGVLIHRLAWSFRRYAPPIFKGAPLSAKVAMTVVAIGGAVVVSPHLAPDLHAATGFFAPIQHPAQSASNGTNPVRTAATNAAVPPPAGMQQTNHSGAHQTGHAHPGRTDSSRRPPVGTSGAGRSGSGNPASPASHPGEPRDAGGTQANPGGSMPSSGKATGGSGQVDAPKENGGPGATSGTSSGSGRGTSSPSGSGALAAVQATVPAHGGHTHGSAASPPNPASQARSGGTSSGSGSSVPPVVVATATVLPDAGQIQATVGAAQTQVSSAPGQAPTIAGAVATPVNAAVVAAQAQAGSTTSQSATHAQATVSAARTAVSQTTGQLGGSVGKAKSTVPPVKKPTAVVTPLPKATPGVPPVTLPPVPTPVPLPVEP